MLNKDALPSVGILGLIFSPFLTLISLIAATYLALIFIIKPQEAKFIAMSKQTFKDHKAIKIAVAGSYGKTSFKEMLSTILNEKFNVAVTPGNMNTSIAHARFVKKLTGEEEIIVLEYGEEHPGDIQKFIDVTWPEYGVIMGLAPNHLDYYKTLDVLANDLLRLRALKDQCFVNGDSKLLHNYIKEGDQVFSSSGVDGWSVKNTKVTVSGISFNLERDKEIIRINSGLVGRHFIAPLAMAAALAYKLGLSIKQIEAGVSKTKAFEHRLQPRNLGGATILDDTYNGNIEGMIAGLELLKELHAKKSIYVTPGLVDQGSETENVHHQLAKKIAEVQPDLVVLMNNSATKIVEEALDKLKYKGDVLIENDPLNFYQNLDKIVAAGDVVLLQNDWTDNYN
jgi:UDP-N-acetylmuramoyl-tripeptide--D-alanyl-D-alanine ligase